VDFDIKPKRIVESDIVTDSIEKADRLQNFLELSNTEFSVLAEVHHMNHEGVKPDINRIRDGYAEWYMRDVSAEDVGKALASLKRMGFVVGDEKYEVIVERIIEYIVNKNIKQETGRLDNSITNNLEYYLSWSRQALVRPILLYLPTNELAAILAKELKESRVSSLYVTSNFPSEMYSDRLVTVYSEAEIEYLTSVRENITKGTLNASYITRFNVEELYDDSLKALEDKEDAYAECIKVLDSIKEHIRFPNLSVYYLKFPFGLDGVLPLGKRPRDFFLKTRDVRSRVTGGIYIKSPLIASHVKRVYEETIRNAAKISERNCGSLIESLKKYLKELHSRQDL